MSDRRFLDDYERGFSDGKAELEAKLASMTDCYRVAVAEVAELEAMLKVAIQESNQYHCGQTYEDIFADLRASVRSTSQPS